MPKESRSFKAIRFVFAYVLAPLAAPLACVLFPFSRLRNALTFTWFPGRRVSSPEAHRQKVARVQQQVRQWHANGRKTRMCTSRPAGASFSMRTGQHRDMTPIQIHDFNSVVEVDTERRVVTVEPGVFIGQLTSILVPRGWTIPVVPELEELSIGGLTCGAGLESSSTRHGYFNDTALEYEIVVSNGDLITCSKEQNSDLFHAIPWSHGTIGFLLSVKLPLVRAKKYVQLEYHPAKSTAEVQRLLESPDHEFVEGFGYGRNKFVVTLGNFSDRPDPKRGPVNNINRWYKPFFYKHVESFFEKGGAARVEFYPLRDYYHRHTRAFFWAFPMALPYSNSAVFRFLFGWMFPVNVKLGKSALLRLGIENAALDRALLNGMVQDYVIPMRHFSKTLDFVHEKVEVYPLWLCPIRIFNNPGASHCAPDLDSELYFDVGVYGEVAEEKKANFRFVETNREFETFTVEHDGVEGLYGPSFLSREQFRKMFDLSLYDKVRVKYGALDAFPDVYDKVSNLTKQVLNV